MGRRGGRGGRANHSPSFKSQKSQFKQQPKSHPIIKNHGNHSSNNLLTSPQPITEIYLLQEEHISPWKGEAHKQRCPTKPQSQKSNPCSSADPTDLPADTTSFESGPMTEPTASDSLHAGHTWKPPTPSPRKCGDYLIGKDPIRIEHHWQYMYRMGPLPRFRTLRCHQRRRHRALGH